jgi:hypothetical protein
MVSKNGRINVEAKSGRQHCKRNPVNRQNSAKIAVSENGVDARVSMGRLHVEASHKTVRNRTSQEGGFKGVRKGNVVEKDAAAL